MTKAICKKNFLLLVLLVLVLVLVLLVLLLLLNIVDEMLEHQTLNAKTLKSARSIETGR